MITVWVRLYATLRSYQPKGSVATERGIALSLPEGTSLRALVEDHLGIPRDTVKMMFVNHRARDDAYVLQDGDEVGIFPPIAGG